MAASAAARPDTAMTSGDPRVTPTRADRRGAAPEPRRKARQDRAVLRVAITDERAGRVPAPRLACWLARVAPARVRGSVSVAIVSDRRVRALNRTYRGIDRPTDVLSFPATTRRARASGRESPATSGFLGDVVIANGMAGRQARAAGHSRVTEFRVLALHGVLHLLGYDHDRDDGRMARVERRLRRKGGLREGLIERAAPLMRPGRGRR